MITLCKLGLLMLSYLGYWEFFRRKWGINVFFLPAFTLAVHFTLFFLSGLLNFLGMAAWGIYLFGFLLLLNALRKEKMMLLKPYLNLGFLLLFLGLFLITVMVKGRLFAWIDNFTHWALVVKNMLTYDCFPTFMQSAVSFTSYPLGSSTLIYYFCKMTSTGEDIQMMAQAYLMLCMLLPIFSYAGKHPVLCGLFLAGMGGALLCYDIPITELLVDTLLPLTAMAATLFLYAQCPKLGTRTPSLYFSLPLLFLTMNIKSSGIFFVIAALIPQFVLLPRRKESRLSLIHVCLLLAVGWFLWNRHCDYVFVKSSHSEHAISLYYFSMQLSRKSWADILQISKLLLTYAFTRRDFLRLGIWMAVLGGFTWGFARSLKKQYLSLLTLSAAAYAAYSIAMLGMYIFSMYPDDCFGLVSADRYFKTIDIAIYYFIAIFAFLLIGQLEKKLLLTGLAVMSAVLILGIGHSRAEPELQDMESRVAIQSLIEEYGIQPGYSYLIIADDTTPYPFSDWICRYFLYSDRVLHLLLTEEAQMEAEKDYDYILILDDDNPILPRWLEDHYPEQASERVIQCFK